MAADGNITKDIIYDAVAPDDFESMLNLDRYGQRSTAFDKIIAATHDHFWDPLDKKYIDFDEPFDMENEPLRKRELACACGATIRSQRIGAAQRVCDSGGAGR